MGWLSRDDCDLDDFRAVVEKTTHIAEYPHAEAVRQNAVVYGPDLRNRIADAAERRAVQAEIARGLQDGPGIVVFAAAFDAAVVDAATHAFFALIDEQRATGTVAGDHFAKPGANDRVWNSLEKLAVGHPEVFADYYANDLVALASQAWLGPNYQVTAAVNVVNPGGQAQVAHRDYHLGFMDTDLAARYPAHVHLLSPALTLQGAVAHCDMPVETGPTMYLPYSQKYPAGYLAAGLPEFTAYFDAHHVQLPLQKGDAVFFNPALFHGAGTNRSPDVRRMANLLQVSSAFGRTIDTVDRARAVRALYPVLARRLAGGADERDLRNVVAASAEGYPFPTNLDRDQPVDGISPPSQAGLVWQALQEAWDVERLDQALSAYQTRHRSSGP